MKHLSSWRGRKALRCSHSKRWSRGSASLCATSLPKTTLPSLLQSSTTGSWEFLWPGLGQRGTRLTSLGWPCTWPATGFPSLESEDGAHPGRV